MPVHGEELFVIVGSNRVPWMYPDKYYEHLVSRTMPEVTPDDDLVAFAQLKYAMASKVKYDVQGRMVLPDKLLKHTGIQTDVTLIGCQDHLEIWNRNQWEERRNYLWNNRDDVERRAKEARRKNVVEMKRELEPH